MADERTELEKAAPLGDGTLLRSAYPGRSLYPESHIETHTYSSGDGYGYGVGKENDALVLLRDLLRAARRRKWLILTVTMLVTVVVTIDAFRVKPVYTASTVIEIRKDSSPLVPMPDSDPQNAVIINTKRLLFASRPLLEDVVVKLKLDENPDFLDSRTRTWWEAVKDIANREATSREPRVSASAAAIVPFKAGLPTGETIEGAFVENPRLDEPVGVLLRGLRPDPLRDTQALKISFTHTDPLIAAQVANQITDSFIKRNFRTSTDKFTHTAEWLDRSTRELQARVQEAEQKLADYTRANNIIALSPEGQATLTTDKLSRLHDQTVRAEFDLLFKRSLYEDVQKGRVAQLPEAFSDAKTGALQSKLNELSQELAQHRLTYGPDNPKVRELEEGMAKIQEQIASGRMSLEQKVKTDYERALRDHQALQVALDAAKGEAAQNDQAAVQFNLLKQNLETARSLYTEFYQKYNQARLEVAQQKSNIDVIQPAQIPRSADGSGRARTILMGFMVSFVGSLGLAFLLERFDNTIKSISDVSRYVQLPTLGVIPVIEANSQGLLPGIKKKRKQQLGVGNGSNTKNGERPNPHAMPLLLPTGTGDPADAFSGTQVGGLDGWSSIAEAYRSLRTSVLLSTAGNPPKTILFTSGCPAEGKTTTVINTAISLAQLGCSVLVVDADLRKPAIQKGFNIKRGPGLSTYLSRPVDIEPMIQKVQIPNLSLLPCGPIPPNPAELIGSERMKEMLRTLGDRYDHILIDSPPLMYVTDPVILSTLVDGVIVVVQGGKSTRDVVRQSRLMLSSVGARIFGVVLNNVDMNHKRYGESYYGYYSEEESERRERMSDMFG